MLDTARASDEFIPQRWSTCPRKTILSFPFQPARARTIGNWAKSLPAASTYFLADVAGSRPRVRELPELGSAPRGRYRLAGLRPSPTSRVVVACQFSRRLTQGPAVRAGRPPPLATPRCVDHDAKCVSAGQVRCRCANGASNTDATPAIRASASQTLTPNCGSAAPRLLVGRRF